MVRGLSLAALVLVAGVSVPLWADEGPALYGDGGGRIWRWQDGVRTVLTPEGSNLVLGGVSADSLWGWSVEGNRSRFFTAALPKEKEKKAKPGQEKPLVLKFETASYPVPDLADRLGDRVLLVWDAQTHPRYEVWKGREQVAARAFDEGSVYAASLGPEGWMIAGRRGLSPWLEVNGQTVEAPEGWRGRLTVALWSGNGATAAGWGAAGTDLPRALFWSGGSWTQAEGDPETSGVSEFPLLGAMGDEGVLLAGWQSDANGVIRPWFWNGERSVPGGIAEGQPQTFSVGDKGAFLVVRHQSAPWFTFEDGVKSQPLEGLGPEDRVVAVEAKASPAAR